jgi:hypothetical protein
MLIATDWTDPAVLGPLLVALIAPAIIWVVRRMRMWFLAPTPRVFIGPARERRDLLPEMLPMTTREKAREWDKRQAAKPVRIEYSIENKEQATTVTELTTGVRPFSPRSGAEGPIRTHGALGPRESVSVELKVPVEILSREGNNPKPEACLYWVRFRDGRGRRWEGVYDPRTAKTKHRRLGRGASD